MSILDIRKVDNKLFYSSTGGWYANEKFAKDKGETGWHLVRKTIVPNSISNNWNEQQVLLAENEETPSAQIMIYTIIGHFLTTGERLFENIYVRTSCVRSDGNRVVVGYFDSVGLFVNGWWDDEHFSLLGLSSARKY